MKPWGIHWFRRDLRITGNKALREIWKKTEGRTVGIFCFDSQFLSRPDFSPNRFAFFLKSLRALKYEFQQWGGDLLVVDQLPLDFYTSLLENLRRDQQLLPQFVSWNRDYEPFSIERDARIAELLQHQGIETITARDHLIFEPHEIKKNTDGFYQVYTPFSRKWFSQLTAPDGLTRIAKEKNLNMPPDEPQKIFQGSWRTWGPKNVSSEDRLDAFEKENLKSVSIPIPNAGFKIARQRLKEFSSQLSAYNDFRDRPDHQATSRLSMFLKNGSLTTAQIIRTLNLVQIGPNQFFKEIVWREFYYHILYHRPDVERVAFNRAYQNLAWENREDLFERWKQGTTGFPIVDAGMRELLTTGWMHNRVRMIVASFLVKDLLIDWRWGERHFMRELLDGDLAANNGGWQWAASTGCDPQPYFRIFNPWLQSKKFDPEGSYIKMFVPELQSASANEIHNPSADRNRFGYPAPIVDHLGQKQKALRLYKK